MEKCGLRYGNDAVYFYVPCVYYAVNRDDYRADEAPCAPRP